MATRIDLPALGQSMEEGTITAWLKKEGDPVREGETLYEVMTDKANIEQPSPVSGILRKILVQENESAPVKSMIAIIGEADEEIEHLLTGNGNVAEPISDPSTTISTPVTVSNGPVSTPSASAPEFDRIFSSPRARRVAEELGISVASLSGKGTGVGGRIVEIDVLNLYRQLDSDQKALKISPLARAIADEHGVDLSSIEGTGASGRVTKTDIDRAISPPSPTSPSTDEGDRTIRLVGMRKMIADNVAKSAQTAPHVTLTLGVDMSEATRFRKQILPTIEKSHGVRVSFTGIIAKATARALQEHPMLNSTLIGDMITLRNAVNLGVAVSLGEAGLVVPVLRHAERKSLPEISTEIKQLAAKAKEGKLSADEMSDGTFSITNLGTFGIESFTPIIAPPQCAILGVCAIKEQPVVNEGAVVARPMMNLSLSFDHRITDGAPAAAFLARLREILEQPYLMFT